MQQRGLSLSELSDLHPCVYDLYFTFCEYIEPRSGIQDAINTALLMQSVYQASTGKPISVHDLHYLIPKKSTQQAQQERKKFTLADAQKWLNS
jgi:hypothetical protein